MKKLLLAAIAAVVVFSGVKELGAALWAHDGPARVHFGHAVAVHHGDQQAEDWEWSGQIESGDAIEIKGINGEIKASATSGDQVVVRAVKESSNGRSDPSSVQIEVVEHSGGVTICTIYPPKKNKPNECAPGDGGRLNAEDNDVSVEFTIEVPAGVNLIAKTVNGDVEAGGIGGEVWASTVNGDVTIDAAGVVHGSTVNGSIRAAMGRADWSGDLSFSTVNGSIELELPADLHADVSASTVNGSMSTDFPLTVSGRFSNKKMRGTIGDGGRDLDLSTVNGSIELRKN